MGSSILIQNIPFFDSLSWIYAQKPSPHRDPVMYPKLFLPESWSCTVTPLFDSNSAFHFNAKGILNGDNGALKWIWYFSPGMIISGSFSMKRGTFPSITNLSVYKVKGGLVSSHFETVIVSCIKSTWFYWNKKMIETL